MCLVTLVLISKGIAPHMQVLKALPKLCVKFHVDVKELSRRFLQEQKRNYYVTPTSYLELLGSYKKLLAKRQDEVKDD